ncbi:MAG: adenylate/guanylate cyclase domain-containing protein [Desulfuromonadaceae bacterium]|nr:adenylate/guanylate cyclase domain-containing protein [Desulfuromonadaceae bacterium]
MRNHALRMAIGLAIMLLFLLHGLGWLQLGLVRQLELWSYDYRLLQTMPGGLDDRIIIVDIDEKSLAEVGRWPWSRNRVAGMVDQLFDHYGVAVVGFDVVFAEPDTSSGLREMEALARGPLSKDADFKKVLNKSRTRLDYDALLASRFNGRPLVLGYYFVNDEAGKSRTSGLLPAPVLNRDAFKGGIAHIPSKSGYGANIPVLQKAAKIGGHFNPDPDPDGVTRRVPMLQEYGGNYYESLSLAVLRAMFGQPDIVPGFPGGRDAMLEWLQVADLRIPVDSSATALIPYRGNQNSFQYVSAADIMNGKVPKKTMEGAIVLVGTTAPGLMDLRSTPVSAVYAGVEIHANMIAGILDGNIRHAPTYARGAELACLVVGGLLLTLLLPFLGPLWSLVLTMALVAGAVTINSMAWRSGLVLPLASQMLLFPLIYAFNASYGFLVESRSKRQLTGLFGQYVPSQIVSRMSKDPQRFTMEAESREMTVLFTDVVGFTTISEKLTPKELALFMNQYLTAMTSIIYEHGGTVDKYIGDAIMAFWGAPLDDPDHALHAVEASLAMRTRMVTLQQEMKTQGFPEIKIGIGINSGQMRVGNMGSSFRVAYTVMGDAVNLASRLEGLTRQYDTWIIVGEVTRAKVEGVIWRDLDLVRVKGKHEPVAIHEPCGKELTLEKQYENDITLFNNMVDSYRRQEWDAAEEILQGLIAKMPDRKLYQFYLTRIKQYQKEPPPSGWDGVCTFTTK